MVIEPVEYLSIQRTTVMGGPGFAGRPLPSVSEQREEGFAQLLTRDFAA
jgi:hypothetical protein